MKKEIFLEGKRGRAGGTLRGSRLRTGRAVQGKFTFEEKRSTDVLRETSGWA
jgi:hypothetical protein